MDILHITVIIMAVFFIQSGLSAPVAHFQPSHAIPQWTIFDCNNRPPGFYADRVRGCRVFNFCSGDGLKVEFVCPGGTLFHQKLQDCVDPEQEAVPCPSIWDVP